MEISRLVGVANAESQDDRFERLRGEFAHCYAGIRAYVHERLVRSDWRDRNAAVVRDLLPRPPRDFLRHPAILYQMFVDERYLEDELPYVTRCLSDIDAMREDPVGAPPTTHVPEHGVVTSSNTVHHLYHLLRYEDATQRRLWDCDVVVEWGGGYGNMGKLVRRLHGGHLTYVLVDTPVFAALQWLYLSAVLGDEHVVLHDRRPVAVVESAINVVPVGLADSVDVEADLFVSTWALNESSPAAQRLVVDREWFGANHLLLAMHAGDPFEQTVLGAGAHSVPLGEFMPAQQYLVR